MADLEEQLHVLATQRDAAILELSSAREEAEGSATALSNLQSVLEQFQRGQSLWEPGFLLRCGHVGELALDPSKIMFYPENMCHYIPVTVGLFPLSRSPHFVFPLSRFKLLSFFP